VAFAAVLTAEDIGSYKPSERNCEALVDEATRLGVAPGRPLYVAQSLSHDHVPVGAAGLPTVGIDRRPTLPGWGATPAPPVALDRTSPSMAAFADAFDAEQT
jgi:2-haloacid dehalogenase